MYTFTICDPVYKWLVLVYFYYMHVLIKYRVFKFQETPSDVSRLKGARERQRAAYRTRECCRRVCNVCLRVPCFGYVCLRCILPTCFACDDDDDNLSDTEQIRPQQVVDENSRIRCEPRTKQPTNYQVENTYIGVIPDFEYGDSIQQSCVHIDYGDIIPQSQNEKTFNSNTSHEEGKKSNPHSMSKIVLLQTDI